MYFFLLENGGEKSVKGTKLLNIKIEYFFLENLIFTFSFCKLPHMYFGSTLKVL